MVSYVENSLGRNERIVYKAQVSWFSQFWRIFFGILLLMWVIGIVFIVFAVLNVMTTELALTNKRVIAKFGFIRRQTIERNINRIESISVRAAVMLRFLISPDQWSSVNNSMIL